MEKVNYTLAAATELARKYQYLIGQKIVPKEDWPIHCVAVAPADRLNKWLFAHIYMDTNDPQASLKFYKKDTYDVILISVYNREAEMLTFKDLNSYLEEQARKTVFLDFAITR